MPLHPHFANRAALLDGFDSIEEAMRDPETAAKLAAAFADDVVEPGPIGDVHDEALDTPVGPLRVKIYRPESLDRTGPAFVWAHGGGFAGGSIDMPEADTVARELAFLHDTLVISADYSLSNGTSVTYPLPHRQMTEVVRWARRESEALGFDPARLALGGASAGANLAFGAMLELRANGEQLPASLVVVYPLLHRTLATSPELEPELASALGPTRMTQGVIDIMFGAYTAGAEAPFASLDDNDLTGFPRTLTIVSEYDDLRPSGEVFHSQAVTEGVDASLYVARGMTHGHLDRMREIEEVGATVRTIAGFIHTR
ncbi:alpha/beta hydrolase [Leifsonia lichenia]